MRYLKISLLIGVLVAVAVSLMVYFGLFYRLDAALCKLVGLPLEEAYRIHYYQFGVIAFCALTIAWTTIDIIRTSLKIFVPVVGLLELAGIFYIASLFGIFFSPIPAAVAMLLAFAIGMVYARSKPGQRKLQLRQLLGTRVSEPKYLQLLDDNSPIEFSGAVRHASVICCRVFNHSEVMAELEPEDYVTIINRWLGCTADYLVEQGAYIDVCDGEGVRCIFGGVMDELKHEAQAVDCALELERKLRNLNGEIEAEWHRKLDFAIGVNSGSLVAATYGAKPLSGYSVSGEVVDFAWRLPRISNDYNITVAVGSPTFVACEEEFAFRPIDMVYGADGIPVEIYHPLGRVNEVDESAVAAAAEYWQAVILTREKETAQARKILEQLSQDDPLVQYYRQRIQMLESFEQTNDAEIRQLSDVAIR